MHQTVQARLARGEVAPVIVGIDHGGASRADELSPFVAPRSAGKLEVLLSWMREELMPRLGRELYLARSPSSIAVGGSSMGGLAALYAHFRFPESFGMAMAMSPSLWVGRGQFFEWLESQKLPRSTKLYLDAGAKEGGGAMLRLAERLAKQLEERGYPKESLRFFADPDGVHNEKDWRRRSPEALHFLFGA